MNETIETPLARIRRKRLKRRSLGMCVRCKEPAEGWRCPSCRERTILRATQRRKELARERAEKGYESVKMLIYQLVHKFSRRSGGDWDELLSEAHVGFMRAWRKFDPSKAKLTTWTQFNVTNTLKDWLEAKIRRDQLHHPLNGHDFEADGRFDLDLFEGELSPDGILAVEAALLSGKKQVVGKRDFVIQTLQRKGWSGDRVLRAFDEVEFALEERR